LLKSVESTFHLVGSSIIALLVCSTDGTTQLTLLTERTFRMCEPWRSLGKGIRPMDLRVYEVLFQFNQKGGTPT